jgi:hypothetical protein
MMGVHEKREDLDVDVTLALKVLSSSNQRNVLTVHSNGRATFQPGFGSSELTLRLDLDSKESTEEYLRRHLPIAVFLQLKEHYYEIPSQRPGGAAASLYLRVNGIENWVGIGNYGRGEIPTPVDANMYKAVLKLEEYLTEG